MATRKAFGRDTHPKGREKPVGVFRCTVCAMTHSRYASEGTEPYEHWAWAKRFPAKFRRTGEEAGETEGGEFVRCKGMMEVPEL